MRLQSASIDFESRRNCSELMSCIQTIHESISKVPWFCSYRLRSCEGFYFTGSSHPSTGLFSVQSFACLQWDYNCNEILRHYIILRCIKGKSDEVLKRGHRCGLSKSVCSLLTLFVYLTGDKQVSLHGASHGHLANRCAWFLCASSREYCRRQRPARARSLCVCGPIYTGGSNRPSTRLFVWPGRSKSFCTTPESSIVCIFVSSRRVHLWAILLVMLSVNCRWISLLDTQLSIYGSKETQLVHWSVK